MKSDNLIFKLIFSAMLFLGFFVLAKSSWAACETPCTKMGSTVTCNVFTNGCVQDAVDNVASAGDTIIFPSPGSVTWSSTVTVSKNLTINGNGTTLTQGGPMPERLFSHNRIQFD